MTGDIENPLAPFERLIGGKWVMGDSFHTFEWGVGQKTVNTRSYFLMEGNPVLVSEGSWFWHPGRQVIKGHMVAIQMGIDLFSYNTYWEGNRMIGDLKSYTPDGGVSHYQEEFDFTDNDTYVWTLYSKSAEGLEKSMDGTFQRQA